MHGVTGGRQCIAPPSKTRELLVRFISSIYLAEAKDEERIAPRAPGTHMTVPGGRTAFLSTVTIPSWIIKPSRSRFDSLTLRSLVILEPAPTHTFLSMMAPLMTQFSRMPRCESSACSSCRTRRARARRVERGITRLGVL